MAPVEPSPDCVLAPNLGKRSGLVPAAASADLVRELSTLALDQAPLGILTVDAAGRIVQANRLLEALFGYARGELLGHDLEILVPPGERALHARLRQAYLVRPAPRAMGSGRSLNGQRKDGSQFPVEIGLSPLVTAHGTFILGTVCDVSAQRLREQQELEARLSQLRKHRSEMSLLGEMSSLLQHAVNEDEVSEVVSAFGAQLFPGTSVGVYVVPNSRTGLRLAVTWGGFTGAKTLELHDCWAVRRAQTHTWRRGGAARCPHHPEQSELQHTCIPMAAQGNVIGVASFVGRPEQVDHDCEVLGKSVADQLGLALSGLQLRERLRNMSIRDPLTDLFNRRYLEETVAREIPRSVRSGAKMCLIMIDVDRFKHYNDTYGHPAGDDALRVVSRVIMESIRREDVACRYGGEEFVILLPGADLDAGIERAERIRKAVSEAADPKLTLSAGVAVFPDRGDTWASLLRAADSALYRAKAEGRNRVVA
jgi:diguanylate cyclase (GGDEF)-like protein/PAS domain S-box-containing protein